MIISEKPLFIRAAFLNEWHISIGFCVGYTFQPAHFLSMAGLLFSFDIYPRGVYNINMIKSFADKETEKVTNDN